MIRRPDGSYDPRRAVIVHTDGPYVTDERGRMDDSFRDNTYGMTRLLKNARWRSYWRQARQDAGVRPEFAAELTCGGEPYWRQTMLENMMQCQGLEGYWMIRPGTKEAESWEDLIYEGWLAIKLMKEEPPKIDIGFMETHTYPDLWNDLWAMCSGYEFGT
ncbi:hypothetical protein F4677DRAFT_464118 [Hypoxylon crocopeplum]|nr:hypothetical protein F4677DRAFT_464118 [Hypoxylon crocopeplum]